MIGISQNNLGIDLGFELGEVNCLDRAGCAYGHEYRCLYRSVIGDKLSRAGFAMRVCGL